MFGSERDFDNYINSIDKQRDKEFFLYNNNYIELFYISVFLIIIFTICYFALKHVVYGLFYTATKAIENAKKKDE
jgi:hypothetical protein